MLYVLETTSTERERKRERSIRSKVFPVHNSDSKLATTGDFPVWTTPHKPSNTADAIRTNLW